MNSTDTVSCINCGIKTHTGLSPVMEQWPAAIAVFTEWLSPYILKEKDYICKFCLDHANNAIRQLTNTGQITDETKPLPSGLLSQIENRKVCVLCGRSLNRNRQRTLLWPNGPERNQLISDLICQERLVPHKMIGADSLACHPCWQKIGRRVHRMQSDITLNQDIQNHDQQNDDQQNDDQQNNDQQNNDQPKNVQQKNELQEECIELPSYRRSPDISDHCVFENCTNQDLHCISNELRAMLIKHHQYLMTAKARVCRKHIMRNKWKKLFVAKNSISTFKPDHVEQVLSFVSTSKGTNIDFNNILDLDNSIVEYFLGLSKESLSVILKTLPELQHVENGVFGLLGLLMKHCNGGPISKVAGLLRICPNTLETAMTHVIEILRNSDVTVNMGIDYLLKTNQELNLKNVNNPKDRTKQLVEDSGCE